MSWLAEQFFLVLYWTNVLHKNLNTYILYSLGTYGTRLYCVQLVSKQVIELRSASELRGEKVFSRQF